MSTSQLLLLLFFFFFQILNLFTVALLPPKLKRNKHNTKNSDAEKKRSFLLVRISAIRRDGVILYICLPIFSPLVMCALFSIFHSIFRESPELNTIHVWNPLQKFLCRRKKWGRKRIGVNERCLCMVLIFHLLFLLLLRPYKSNIIHFFLQKEGIS